MRETIIWILVVAILTSFVYIQGLQEQFCKAEQDCFDEAPVRDDASLKIEDLS